MAAARGPRRWLTRGIPTLVLALLVGGLLWTATAGSMKRFDAGAAQSHAVRGCDGYRLLEWRSEFSLSEPVPARLVPKVHYHLSHLQGSQDGEVAVWFDVVLNGVTVAKRLIELQHRAGGTEDVSGTVARGFDDMVSFPHRAGRNELSLAVAVTCKMPTASALGFELELGPAQVVTQDRDPWLDW